VDELLYKILNSHVPSLLLEIGIHNKMSKKNIASLIRMCPSSYQHVSTGPLSNDSLSKVLQLTSFAVSTYPIELAGKSSAIAALQDHGNPVYFIGHNIRHVKSLPLLEPKTNLSFARLNSLSSAIIPNFQP